MQTELVTASALLHLALEAGRAVGWDWDVTTGTDSWFGDLQTIFGIPSPTFSGHVEDFRRRVHPEDREQVWSAVKEAMEGRSPYVAEFRVIRADAAVRWLAARGQFHYSPDGRPQRMLGIAIDITDRKRSEEALAESEARLRLAAQAGRMYAYEWDSASDVIVRSAECAHILGLPGEPEVTTCKEMYAAVHPDDRARVAAAVAGSSPENPTHRVQYRLVRPDGSVVWLEKNGHAFFNRDGKMVRMIGMVADISERKLAEEALAGLGRRLIEAQEAERARIARELHDDIGQRLALMLITMDQRKLQALGPDEETFGGPDELRREIVDLSKSIHNLSHRLHSATLNHLGMMKAMRGFCTELSEQQDVEINFSHDRIPKDVPQEISLCLFRVLQEALHNAVKHSRARRFDVDLRGASDAVSLTVRDSGVGFNPQTMMRGSGLGLISMRERLNLVNGQLSIDSRRQGGTTIHAFVPLTANVSAQAAVRSAP